MVAKIRESPNDQLIVDLLKTIGINLCSDLLSGDLCRILATKFEKIAMSHLFNLIVTEAYICSHVMPLCEQQYETLRVEDYAWRLLKNKPAVIADDDFLNNLYASLNSNRASYRVLQITDWHLDLHYQ